MITYITLADFFFVPYIEAIISRLPQFHPPLFSVLADHRHTFCIGISFMKKILFDRTTLLRKGQSRRSTEKAMRGLCDPVMLFSRIILAPCIIQKPCNYRVYRTFSRKLTVLEQKEKLRVFISGKKRRLSLLE